MKKVLFLTYMPSSSLENQLISLLGRQSLLSQSFECVFYDLSERNIGYWELAKRITSLVQSEGIYKCYLIPSAERGIALKDYLVKNIISRLGQTLVIHYPENSKVTWMSLLLRRAFFSKQKVVISNWRDYVMVKYYTPKENILVCPEADGVEITLDKLEKKLVEILNSSK